MATKVGAFKKDGTVQCVKLVEESSSSKLTSFGGTISSSQWKCENGLRFNVTVNGTSSNSIVSRIALVTKIGDTILVLNKGSSNFTASDGGNTNQWNSTFDYEIDVIGIIFSSSIQTSSGTVSCEIIDGDKSYTYTYTASGSLTGTNFGLSEHSENTFVLKHSDRFNIPTVRMCKDGTLKCAKLIEEKPSVFKQDDFCGKVSNNILTLNNGMTIKLTINSNVINLSNCKIQLIDSGHPAVESTIVLQVNGNDSIVYFPSTSLWTKDNFNINNISISGFSVSNPMVSSVNINYKEKEYIATGGTFTGSSAVNMISFGITFPSISQEDLFKPATVRVYKDGTIRCAKVQEGVSSWT